MYWTLSLAVLLQAAAGSAHLHCQAELWRPGTLDCRDMGVRFNSLLDAGSLGEVPNANEISSIKLSDANIITFNSVVFNRFRLAEHLDMSKNNLMDLKESSFQPLGKLISLNLSSNIVSSLDLITFKGLLELRALDISRNQLFLQTPVFSELKKLRILDVSYNLEVNVTSLKLSPTLRSFIASRTLTHLDQQSFARNNQLTNLVLSYAKLRSIPPKLLDNCATLVSLDLSSNSLETTTFPPDLLSRLVNLLDINLSRNKFDAFNNALTFSSNKKLKRIDLSENTMTSLNMQLFASNPNLIVLKLRKNRLQRLPAKLLINLVNLEYLDLSNNLLGSLPIGVFSKVVKLDTLILSGNSLKSLRDDSFLGSNNLRILDLSKNLLELFQAAIIANLNSLLSLNLHRNQLSRVDFSLQDSYSLSELSLSCNNLTLLPETFFHDQQNIITLYLNGNPWKCACLNEMLGFNAGLGDDYSSVTYEPRSFIDGESPSCLVTGEQSCNPEPLTPRQLEEWEKVYRLHPGFCQY